MKKRPQILVLFIMILFIVGCGLISESELYKNSNLGFEMQIPKNYEKKELTPSKGLKWEMHLDKGDEKLLLSVQEVPREKRFLETVFVYDSFTEVDIQKYFKYFAEENQTISFITLNDGHKAMLIEKVFKEGEKVSGFVQKINVIRGNEIFTYAVISKTAIMPDDKKREKNLQLLKSLKVASREKSDYPVTNEWKNYEDKKGNFLVSLPISFKESKHKREEVSSFSEPNLMIAVLFESEKHDIGVGGYYYDEFALNSSFVQEWKELQMKHRDSDANENILSAQFIVGDDGHQISSVVSERIFQEKLKYRIYRVEQGKNGLFGKLTIVVPNSRVAEWKEEVIYDIIKSIQMK